MTKHRLDPLLKPDSIALLGASDRPDSPGQVLARQVIDSGFPGEVYPVNPGYQTVHGRKCYPDLAALPTTVDHVIIALGNERLEAALAELAVGVSFAENRLVRIRRIRSDAASEGVPVDLGLTGITGGAIAVSPAS